MLGVSISTTQQQKKQTEYDSKFRCKDIIHGAFLLLLMMVSGQKKSYINNLPQNHIIIDISSSLKVQQQAKKNKCYYLKYILIQIKYFL